MSEKPTPEQQVHVVLAEALAKADVLWELKEEAGKAVRSRRADTEAEQQKAWKAHMTATEQFSVAVQEYQTLVDSAAKAMWRQAPTSARVSLAVAVATAKLDRPYGCDDHHLSYD